MDSTCEVESMWLSPCGFKMLVGDKTHGLHLRDGVHVINYLSWREVK